MVIRITAFSLLMIPSFVVSNTVNSFVAVWHSLKLFERCLNDVMMVAWQQVRNNWKKFQISSYWRNLELLNLFSCLFTRCQQTSIELHVIGSKYQNNDVHLKLNWDSSSANFSVFKSERAGGSRLAIDKIPQRDIWGHQLQMQFVVSVVISRSFRFWPAVKLLVVPRPLHVKQI